MSNMWNWVVSPSGNMGVSKDSIMGTRLSMLPSVQRAQCPKALLSTHFSASPRDFSPSHRLPLSLPWPWGYLQFNPNRFCTGSLIYDKTATAVDWMHIYFLNSCWDLSALQLHNSMSKTGSGIEMMHLWLVKELWDCVELCVWGWPYAAY